MDPSAPRPLDRWRQLARRLKLDIAALYLAYRDPRVPWPAKLFTALVVGYALSPIDLIPDMIPVLGYLDDLILVPLGIYLALRMIPPPVLAECRQMAADRARPAAQSRCGRGDRRHLAGGPDGRRLVGLAPLPQPMTAGRTTGTQLLPPIRRHVFFVCI